MTRSRILITRRWPDEVEQHLQQRYEVTLNQSDEPLDAAALAAAMRQYDALCITVTDQLTADILRTTPARVRMLGNFGVGTDNIDLAAARAAGIVVSNTPDVLTDATADLAIMLMLMATRRAGEGERELRAGRWRGWRPIHLLGRGLRERTLGVVGMGRIGQAVAHRARAFGLRIAYYNRRRMPESTERLLDATYFASLDELLARSDIVSLHCPGGAATHHLIDGRRLAAMQSSAVLINTARGSVVDEAALAQALAKGVITAAGLDVYEREPAVEAALLRLDNVVLLPHLGSATRETRIAMGMKVVRNLDAFFDGVQVPDRVEQA